MQDKSHYHIWLTAIFLFVFPGYADAQIDSVKIGRDTIIIHDTVCLEKKSQKNYYREDAFILYAGVNFNDLKVSSPVYESVSGTGFHLGFAYKREGFFYWGVGARLNKADYDLYLHNSTDTIRDAFSVIDLDVPITAGINFLPFAKRVANFHAFVSAVPNFEVNVGENSLGITKDSTNTFRFSGQAGLGLDVFFFVLEGGYNFGFTDLIKGAASKPNQVFVSLGFRF